MTVTSTTAINTYTGDGADTTFNFSFKILDESHLLVRIRTIATGAYATQTITTDYTVTGTGNDPGQTNYSSGTVTMLTAPTTLQQVVITRQVPRTQEIDYMENDSFPAETAEMTIDKLTMIAQEQEEQMDLLVTIDAVSGVDPTLSIGADDALKYVRVNTDGDGLEMADLVDAPTYTFPGGTGILSQTASGIAAARTITGTANEITLVNGNGVSGNPTISIPTALTFTGKTITAGTYKAPLIKDTDGNVAVNLSSGGAAAVNYMTITSATTGTGVSLVAAGSDSNIDFSVYPKNTGYFYVNGNAGAYMRFPNTDGAATQFLSLLDTHILQWTTPAYQYVSSVTVSAAASVTIDLPSTPYTSFLLHGMGVSPATDAVHLYARFRTTGGAIRSAGTDYDGSMIGRGWSGTMTRSDTAAQLYLSDIGGTSFGNAAGEFSSFHMYIDRPASSSTRTQIRCHLNNADTASHPNNCNLFGCVTTTEANDQIQLLFSSGNIANGIFTLYGMV